MLSDDVIRLSEVDPDIADGPYALWMQDPEVLRYLEVRFASRTKEDLRAFVAGVNHAPNQHLFGIFLKDTGIHVGNIKLHVDPHHRRGDIGIILGSPAARGRGIGTRAIRLLSEYAFGKLGLQKLTAGCYGLNTASIKAFQKAGFIIEAVREAHFECEGERVDGIFMGLLPSRE